MGKGQGYPVLYQKSMIHWGEKDILQQWILPLECSLSLFLHMYPSVADLSDLFFPCFHHHVNDTKLLITHIVMSSTAQPSFVPHIPIVLQNISQIYHSTVWCVLVQNALPETTQNSKSPLFSWHLMDALFHWFLVGQTTLTNIAWCELGLRVMLTALWSSIYCTQDHSTTKTPNTTLKYGN